MHMCFELFCRHQFIGDRPLFADAWMHLGLFHRYQHECRGLQSGGDKRANANIALTHSSLKKDSDLDKRYSYETFIAQRLRQNVHKTSVYCLFPLGSPLSLFSYTFLILPCRIPTPQTLKPKSLKPRPSILNPCP